MWLNSLLTPLRGAGSFVRMFWTCWGSAAAAEEGPGLSALHPLFRAAKGGEGREAAEAGAQGAGAHQLVEARGDEGRVAGGALVQDAPDRPQVRGGRVRGILLEELGRHVAGGAALGLEGGGRGKGRGGLRGACRALLAPAPASPAVPFPRVLPAMKGTHGREAGDGRRVDVAELPAQPKASELDAAVLVQEDVARLQVAVDYGVRVELAQGGDEVTPEIVHRRLGELQVLRGEDAAAAAAAAAARPVHVAGNPGAARAQAEEGGKGAHLAYEGHEVATHTELEDEPQVVCGLIPSVELQNVWRVQGVHRSDLPGGHAWLASVGIWRPVWI